MTSLLNLHARTGRNCESIACGSFGSKEKSARGFKNNHRGDNWLGCSHAVQWPPEVRVTRTKIFTRQRSVQFSASQNLCLFQKNTEQRMFFFRKKGSNFSEVAFSTSEKLRAALFASSNSSIFSSASELHSGPSLQDLFSESCQSSSVSQKSGNCSCHKVRSSRPSGNLPTLGLDDLTLWHEQLLDLRETLLHWHVSLKTSSSSFWPPFNPPKKKRKIFPNGKVQNANNYDTHPSHREKDWLWELVQGSMSQDLSCFSHFMCFLASHKNRLTVSKPRRS